VDHCVGVGLVEAHDDWQVSDGRYPQSQPQKLPADTSCTTIGDITGSWTEGEQGCHQS